MGKAGQRAELGKLSEIAEKSSSRVVGASPNDGADGRLNQIHADFILFLGRIAREGI
jgi:hypothetical protein